MSVVGSPNLMASDGTIEFLPNSASSTRFYNTIGAIPVPGGGTSIQLLFDSPVISLTYNDFSDTTGPRPGGGCSGCPTIATMETPLPAALPLFTTGLGALGLLGWRRKRKNAAV